MPRICGVTRRRLSRPLTYCEIEAYLYEVADAWAKTERIGSSWSSGSSARYQTPREGWQRTETNRRLLVIMRTPTVRIALYGPRRGLLHRHL